MLETIDWTAFLKLLNNSDKTINFIPSVNNSQDITKVAVSLANLNGGIIIIGFDKYNLQLRGVDFDAKWLNAILYNECKPTITFSIRDTLKNKKRVFIVEVKEGQEKPYSTYGISYVKQDHRIQELSSIAEPVAILRTKPEPIKPEKKPAGSNISSREQKCIDYLQQNHIITNSKYREINMVSHKTAHNELSDLMNKGMVRQVGQGRSTSYVLTGSDIKIDVKDDAASDGDDSEQIKSDATGQNDLFGETIESLLKKNNNNISKTEIRKSVESEHMTAHITKNEGHTDETGGEANYVFNDEILEE